MLFFENRDVVKQLTEKMQTDIEMLQMKKKMHPWNWKQAVTSI